MPKIKTKKKLSNIVKNLFKAKPYKLAGKGFVLNIKSYVDIIKSQENTKNKILSALIERQGMYLLWSATSIISGGPLFGLTAFAGLEGILASRSLYATLKCDEKKLGLIEEAMNNPSLEFSNYNKIANLDLDLESPKKQELFKQYIKNVDPSWDWLSNETLEEINKITNEGFIDLILEKGINNLYHNMLNKIAESQELEEFQNLEEGFMKDLFRNLLVNDYSFGWASIKSALKELDGIEFNKKYEEYYLSAAKHRWALSDIEGLEKTLNKSSYVKEYFNHLLKRGFSQHDITWNIADYTKNKEISKDAKRILDIIFKKAERVSMINSLKTISQLEKLNEKEVLKQIASLGKKRVHKLLNSVNPLVELYGDSVGEVLGEYIAQGHDFSSPTIVKDFNEFLEAKILSYFDIEKVSKNLNLSEKAYLLRGYNKNKDVDNAKEFTSAVLSGIPTFEFKKRPENIDEKVSEVWEKGYFAEEEKSISLKLDMSQTTKDNYNEALEHLERAEFKFNLANDMYETASVLIPQLEGEQDPLLQDALEHLKFVTKHKISYEYIEGNSISYKTGDLKDMAFIGVKPQSTCLNLERQNSDCTISMASKYNVLPFLVSVKTNEEEFPSQRALLRLEGDYLIVDDIYRGILSDKLDFIEHVNNFAKSMGKTVAISKRELDKLSDNDQKKFKENTELEYHVGELIYSDSLAGRVKDNLIKHKYFIL